MSGVRIASTLPSAVLATPVARPDNRPGRGDGVDGVGLTLGSALLHSAARWR
jgi:hypothetical protein